MSYLADMEPLTKLLVLGLWSLAAASPFGALAAGIIIVMSSISLPKRKQPKVPISTWRYLLALVLAMVAFGVFFLLMAALFAVSVMDLTGWQSLIPSLGIIAIPLAIAIHIFRGVTHRRRPPLYVTRYIK